MIRLYIVDSEPELKRGYADLSFIIRPDKHHLKILDHLMEFKSIKLTDLKLTGQDLQSLSDDELQALPQIQATFSCHERLTTRGPKSPLPINIACFKRQTVSLSVEVTIQTF